MNQLGAQRLGFEPGGHADLAMAFAQIVVGAIVGRMRGEVQPPVAYPQFRLRMAAVCKTAPFTLKATSSVGLPPSELGPIWHWNG